MKNLIKLVLTLAIAFSAIQVKAQYAIKVNSLSIFIATLNVKGEFQTSPTQSLQFGSELYGLRRYKGYGINSEYRFYFDGKALSGFYAGPSARFQSLKILKKENPAAIGINDDLKLNLTRFGAGGIMGYQKIFKKGFAIDFYFGCNYSFNAITYTDKNNYPDYVYKPILFLREGISPRIGLTIGFGSTKNKGAQ